MSKTITMKHNKSRILRRSRAEFELLDEGIEDRILQGRKAHGLQNRHRGAKGLHQDAERLAKARELLGREA